MKSVSRVGSRSAGFGLRPTRASLVKFGLFVATLALQGCGTTTKGAVRVVSPEGAVGSADSTGWTSKFVEAEKAARKDSEDSTKAALMLNRGFSLVKANCAEFFDSAGNTQRWIVFTRDTVVAVGTLATAVLAFHNAGENSIANVAFATAATVTGLDLYTKNFLFAAENVNSVMELVLRALDVHSAAVSQLGTLTYGSALTALMDNQNICAPMHITSLAREAIKKGNVVPMNGAGDGLVTATRVQDERVLNSLGAVLNPPGAVSTKQAGALWWLLRDASSPKEREDEIAPRLAELPPATDPFDRPGGGQPPKLKSVWPQQSQVADLLDRFSEVTKDEFRSTISVLRPSAGGGGGPVRAVPPGPVPPPFTLGVSRSAPISGHISVGIKDSR